MQIFLIEFFDYIDNKQDCGYDGGDCCECDCLSGSEYSCGVNEFNCLDPASDCVHPLATQFPSCSGILDSVGDQYCNAENNNEVNQNILTDKLLLLG